VLLRLRLERLPHRCFHSEETHINRKVKHGTATIAYDSFVALSLC
jgi:hypothetical protein